MSSSLAPPVVATPSSAPHPSPGHPYRLLMVVAMGAFSTTFAQPRGVAHLALQNLLRDQFHLDAERSALYFFVTGFFWNLKPVAGVLTDAFPLFGTRRRAYMLLGSAAAAALWLGIGLSGSRYDVLLGLTVLVNVALVFASTVMGGLMVEAGQTLGAPGRVTSLRQGVQSVVGILAPAVGGYLATRPFAWTTGMAAAAMAALTAVAWWGLREPNAPAPAAPEVAPRAKLRVSGRVATAVGLLLLVSVGLAASPAVAETGYALLTVVGMFVGYVALATVPTRNAVLLGAQRQLTDLYASRPLWMAVAMLFLVYTVPGLSTALYYRQRDLGMDARYIGSLGSLEGLAGLPAVAIYAWACRRIALRPTLVVVIALGALSTLLYAGYDAGSAPVAHGVGAFFGTLGELALMDLAVRSTPRGCEALGFASMMAVRNLGAALSDVLGTQLMAGLSIPFDTMVYANASTTLLVLAFVPFLPRAILLQRDGDGA